jgi:hypothetical protein
VLGRLIRPAAWLAFAALVTWPLLAHPAARLAGHPDVDVWNHAWGYWWVADRLSHGEFPLHTDIVGAPKGGTLWFIDFVGALLATPLTLLGGPAVGYNLALLGRVAFAGFAAQKLAEEVAGEGSHTWLAGVAYASTPFLLGELHNGISEVCAVGGVPMALCALERAISGKGRWWTAGLWAGALAATSFYYGLTFAVLAALRSLWGASAARLRGLASAALVAACIAAPTTLAFRWSLSGDDALIERQGRPGIGLLAHNAVDPREYLAPGDFQSVPLQAKYKEAFVHTAYLRWSVLLPAVWFVARRREGRPLVAPATASLVLGLGAFLWWNQDFVRVGGRLLSLPFYWLLGVFPAVSITHPFRLTVGAQAVAAVLASGAAASRRWLALPLGAAMLAETALFSAATWPIPTSDARVPAVYAALPPGMVLDLPALVGETMAMQRYFWFQTVHRRPLPYPPDIRINRPRDVETMWVFQGLIRRAEQDRSAGPPTLDPNFVAWLRKAYAGIVVHLDLEAQAGVAGWHRRSLEPALGAPREEDGCEVWAM